MPALQRFRDPGDFQAALEEQFKNAAKTAEFGRQAAEATLPEIKRLLKHADEKLFPY